MRRCERAHTNIQIEPSQELSPAYRAASTCTGVQCALGAAARARHSRHCSVPLVKRVPRRVAIIAIQPAV
jgi:hypothetical protein